MTLAEIPMEDLIAEFTRRTAPKPRCRATTILAAVCECCDVTVESAVGKRRTRRLADTRMIAATILITKFPNWSQKEVAAFLGQKNHSSTIHYVKRATERYNSDEGFRELMKESLKETKFL